MEKEHTSLKFLIECKRPFTCIKITVLKTTTVIENTKYFIFLNNRFEVRINCERANVYYSAYLLSYEKNTQNLHFEIFKYVLQ